MKNDVQRQGLSKPGITFAAFGILMLLAMVGRYFDRGPLITAFDQAWRDSFGTDVTEDIAPALPLGRPARNLIGDIEDNEFTCNRLELLLIKERRDLWACHRRRLRFSFLDVKYERWTLEFECAPELPHCTIIKHFAWVR